jgi:hypothetical protein
MASIRALAGAASDTLVFRRASDDVLYEVFVLDVDMEPTSEVFLRKTTELCDVPPVSVFTNIAIAPPLVVADSL